VKQKFKKSISAGKKISDPADKTEISGISRNFERYCEPWVWRAVHVHPGAVAAATRGAGERWWQRAAWSTMGPTTEHGERRRGSKSTVGEARGDCFYFF